jgi:hypothetical protein
LLSYVDLGVFTKQALAFQCSTICAPMADIFISYANEDKETAARLAGFLESVGWSVWWDRRIPAGRSWRSVLQEALKDMRCMIALWSRDSVESPWVAEEAEEARKLGKTLVPILIQRVEPPIGFRTIQAADLVNWDGSVDDPAAKMLIADLESLLGAPSAKAPERNKVAEKSEVGRRPAPFQRPKVHSMIAAFAGIALVAFLVGWQIWKSPEQDNRAPRSPAQDDNSKKFTAPRLIGLAVSGERKEIKPAESVKLRVTANFADGTRNDVKEGIEWTSSDPRVATVSEQGEVKGLQAGATRISAKIGDVVSSGWTLGVKAVEPEVKPVAAPNLVALSISSSRNELFTHEKILVRAKGLYSDNSEKLLSNAVDWETSDRTIASIGEQGQLQTLRPGKVEILARSGHLRSKPLAILVKETQSKAQTQAKSITPVDPQPVVPPILSEQSKARVLGMIARAKTFREQGNYAAALAELDKAKAIDAANEDVRTEIEQTKRACNAEKVLGNTPNC